MANCCAYVAVKTDPKTTKDVYRKFADTRHVKCVDKVAGRYDIMVRIESPSNTELFNTVLNELRAVPGVTHTETWPICE